MKIPFIQQPFDKKLSVIENLLIALGMFPLIWSCLSESKLLPRLSTDYTNEHSINSENNT